MLLLLVDGAIRECFKQLGWKNWAACAMELRDASPRRAVAPMRPQSSSSVESFSVAWATCVHVVLRRPREVGDNGATGFLDGKLGAVRWSFSTGYGA